MLYASKGGFGGPDKSCRLVTQGSFCDLAPAAVCVDELMDLPAVTDFVRSYEADMEQSCWQCAVERVHAERAATRRDWRGSRRALGP